jgi:hypothetical protein
MMMGFPVVVGVVVARMLLLLLRSVRKDVVCGMVCGAVELVRCVLVQLLGG